MPLLGIVIVPVEVVGVGLTPGDAISVAPKGIPVGGTDEPAVMPSGEVAPTVGVGLAIPLICAMAALEMISAERTAAINENFIDVLTLWSGRSPRTIRSGRCSMSCLAPRPTSLVSRRTLERGRRQEAVWLEEGAHRTAPSNWAARLFVLMRIAQRRSDKSRAVGRWLARPSSSIKYAFMFSARILWPVNSFAQIRTRTEDFLAEPAAASEV